MIVFCWYTCIVFECRRVDKKKVPLFETPVSLKFHMLLVHMSEGCSVCSHNSRQMLRSTAVAVQHSDSPLVLLGCQRSYTRLMVSKNVGS